MVKTKPMEEGQVGPELASSLQARRLCVTEQTMNTAALMTRVYRSSRAIAGLAAALDATIFAILP
jgi:hypothetical protein